MSNTRYIELDSRFRNRKEWPNPAEFEIPISQSGIKGAVDALDPVSLAASIGGGGWTGNRFATIATAPPTSTIRVIINAAPLVDSSSGFTVFVTTATAGLLQIFPDYYAGAVLSLFPIPAIPIRSRILEYKYLGNDRAQITVSTNITASMVVGSTWDINDPSDFSALWAPLLFVPGPIVADNFLVNRIVYNETLDQSRPLGNYNSPTSIVPLITSGSTLSTRTSGPITALWSPSNNFSIRNSIPPFQTTLNSDPVNCPSTSTSFNLPTTVPTVSVGGFLEKLAMPSRPVLAMVAVAGATSEIIFLNAGDSPGGSPGNDNFYTGCLIRFITGPAQGQIRVIVAYNEATNAIVVEPGFAPGIAPVAANTYTLFCSNESRRIIKYVDFRANALSAPSVTTFVLPAIDSNGVIASNINGFYVGIYVLATVSGDIRIITDYTVVTTAGVTTRTVTLNSAWVFAAPFAFTITSGIVSQGFTSSICTNVATVNNLAQNFCYLPFYRDSFNPFVYTGSLTSQQDMVCYEVTLLNLILPNITLDTAYGGLISFYPYIYVQLQNVSSAGAGLKNIIYSNNPAATKMTFRCPIKDVPNPSSSRFIKLDGNGMTQTIKFKPNDNLQFSVHMATGEIFKTLLPDSFGPSAPDPLAQISAAFAIKRL
jgi:hypothetical protein